MGRFMSPDWSAKVAPVPYAKLDDPQSLNLYVYVLNNPLDKTDPDGHDFWDKVLNTIQGKGWVDTSRPALGPAPKAPGFGAVDFNGHKSSNPRVTEAAFKVSKYFGSKVDVVSGDRDSRPKGSPPRSEHLFHDAIDFHVEGVSNHEVKEALKAPDSPVAKGFDIIEHGPYTGTEAAHVHMDGGVGQGKDPDSRSTFKHEGMTPGTANQYIPEKVNP